MNIKNVIALWFSRRGGVYPRPNPACFRRYGGLFVTPGLSFFYLSLGVRAGINPAPTVSPGVTGVTRCLDSYLPLSFSGRVAQPPAASGGARSAAPALS